MMYKICDSLDFEKACYGTLKKVFSQTLFPKILVNTQNHIFEKIFQKYAHFECFLMQNSQKFAKKVHLDCFDIGLFFFEIYGNLYLKIYDGNGYVAGKFITNIFDYVFSLDRVQFKNYKKEVEKMYKSLRSKKLLVQK